MMNDKIYLESLGCTKNLIDAEMMLGLLKEYGFEIANHISEATIAVINTCGFIESAKEESISHILAAARYKDSTLKKLIVTGCLSERYHQELMDEMPEIDGLIGTGRFEEIAEVVEGVMKEIKELRIGKTDQPYHENLVRLRTSPGYMAYVKIAEGCDHRCTYCIIPTLRGPLRSREMQAIIRETQLLAEEGVKELILIAQDTTSYGVDLHGHPMLPELLTKLEKIDGIEWIRLMYCYPERVTPQLVQVMKNSSKICGYMDLPIQHSEDRILRRMHRHTTRGKLLSTIKMMREAMPNIKLRTTLIVGFPGETQEEFQALKAFVEEVKFDKLGVFTYSQEENTPAAKLKDQVDENIKEARQEEIMKVQQKISSQIQRARIGNEETVLVEELLEDEGEFYQYAGRTEGDAPEIDGLVYIHSKKKLTTGQLVNVKITDALEYDLMGVIADEIESGE